MSNLKKFKSREILGKILIFVAILLLLIGLYIKNNKIFPWNGVMTEAKKMSSSAENLHVTTKNEINWYNVFFSKPGRGSITKKVNYENLLYAYTVNGTEYRGTDDYKMGELSNVKGNDNDAIQIIYDYTNPSKSKIGKLEYTFDIKNETEFIIIIIGIMLIWMGVVLIVLDTPLESDFRGIREYNEIKNEKHKIFKVQKIEIIDYERERIIFIDNEQNLYIYETDFGEDFKENEIYTIKLNHTTQKRIKIEYNGDRTKAIQIVSTEKCEFKKKE